jgi:hypothetical protein
MSHLEKLPEELAECVRLTSNHSWERPELSDMQRMLEQEVFTLFDEEIELPEKERWYRVSVGKFPTIEQAQLFTKYLAEKRSDSS